MTEIKTEKAKKREHVLVDVKVEADLSNMFWPRICKDTESKAKTLEQAAKDFHDFLRDHRSQDLVTLSVQRIYKDLCSVCGEEWGTYEENGIRHCSYCGTEIEETE